MMKILAEGLVAVTILLSGTVQAQTIELYGQNNIDKEEAIKVVKSRFGTDISILSNKRLFIKKVRRVALKKKGERHTIYFYDKKKKNSISETVSKSV